MSYKNLEIWKLADELVVEIHQMTLTKLPKFGMFEEGGKFEGQVNQSNQQLLKVMAGNVINQSS